MRKFFEVRKIFKPPFESVVSVDDLIFLVHDDYGIPKLPEKIKLFHDYIIFY
jgi:hypothetical protein